MVRRVTQCINSAILCRTRIVAGLYLEIAVFIVGAFVVCLTFRSFRNTIASGVQLVPEFNRTHAIAAFIDDQTTLKSTNASATLVNLHSLLYQT